MTKNEMSVAGRLSNRDDIGDLFRDLDLRNQEPGASQWWPTFSPRVTRITNTFSNKRI